MSSDERPILFLLPPSFLDPDEGEGPFVCPNCMVVEGILGAYPQIRRELDVRYVPFKRPRTAIIDLVGVEYQACPMLAMPCDRAPQTAFALTVGEWTLFVGDRAIAEAFAAAYGSGRLH